jgi:hypothetical protein
MGAVMMPCKWKIRDREQSINLPQLRDHPFALRQQRSLVSQQDCPILDELPARSGLRQGQWMIDFPNAMKYY